MALFIFCPRRFFSSTYNSLLASLRGLWRASRKDTSMFDIRADDCLLKISAFFCNHWIQSYDGCLYQDWSLTIPKYMYSASRSLRSSGEQDVVAICMYVCTYTYRYLRIHVYDFIFQRRWQSCVLLSVPLVIFWPLNSNYHVDDGSLLDSSCGSDPCQCVL